MRFKILAMLGTLALVGAVGILGLATASNDVFTHVYAIVNKGPERADLRAAITTELNSANSTIEIAMHAFTDLQLANELVALKAIHDDELEIRVVFDDNAMHREATREFCEVFAEAEIRVYITQNLHLNLAILDSERVITGSAHWTAQSLVSQANDVVVLRSGEIAEIYAQAFERIVSESQPGCDSA